LNRLVFRALFHALPSTGDDLCPLLPEVADNFCQPPPARPKIVGRPQGERRSMTQAVNQDPGRDDPNLHGRVMQQAEVARHPFQTGSQLKQVPEKLIAGIGRPHRRQSRPRVDNTNGKTA
jgi:hypothetical protein